MVVVRAVRDERHAATDIFREVQILRAVLVFGVFEIVLDEAVVEDV